MRADKLHAEMKKAAAFQGAELDAALGRAKGAGGYAGDVLRSDLLSVGVYVLPAQGIDSQKPHDEDEVYFAVRGRAKFRVGAVDHDVQPGSLLFVPAKEPHHFHQIEQELVLVVFWAPPH